MTSKDRAILKKHAQHVKSTFQIGAGELHDSNLEALVLGLNNKEIIKVKVNRADKQDKQITRDIANQIEAKTDIEVVDVIGTTIILYRMSKNPENRILG